MAGEFAIDSVGNVELTSLGANFFDSGFTNAMNISTGRAVSVIAAPYQIMFSPTSGLPFGYADVPPGWDFSQGFPPGYSVGYQYETGLSIIYDPTGRPVGRMTAVELNTVSGPIPVSTFPVDWVTIEGYNFPVPHAATCRLIRSFQRGRGWCAPACSWLGGHIQPGGVIDPGKNYGGPDGGPGH